MRRRLPDGNVDLAAFDLYRVAGQPASSGVCALSGAGVEGPAVCGASELLSIEVAVGQRHILVRAQSRVGLDLSTAQPDQQNLLAFDIHLQHLPDAELLLPADPGWPHVV